MGEPSTPDTNEINENPGPGSSGETSVIGWRDLHLWEVQPVRDVLLVLAVVGLFVLGDAISVVTVPLLLAVLLAYLLEPVVRWVEGRTSLKRPTIVAGMLVAFILVVVVPTIAGMTFGVAQIATLLTSTSSRIELVYQSVQSPENTGAAERVANEAGPAWVWIRDRIVENTAGGDLDYVLDMLRARMQEGAGALIGSTASAGADALRSIAGLLGGLLSAAFGVFLTGFFFYFVSTGWVEVRSFAATLLPERHRERIIDLAGKFDGVISGFVRGRLTIAFVQGVFFSLAYWIIGVPAAFVVGPAVAVLSIVPYLSLVGIPVSIGLLWLESRTGFRGAWWWVLAAPVVVYMVGQAMDDYVLTPAIQGKTTNMDTPTILFASLAGGALFGIFGVLIAIPLAACVKILVGELVWPAFKDWAEGRSEDPLPIERGK